MSIDGELVLPRDVEVRPVSELPQEVRAKLDASDQDYTITRPRSRIASSVLDRDSADLIEGFRAPARIVDAILQFARRRGLDPESTLEKAYPLLSRLYRSGLLVPAGDAAAKPIDGLLRAGSTIDGFRLLRSVQVLDDNEVFLAKGEDGRFAAVKFYRTREAEVAASLEREARMLRRAGPESAPRVLRVFRDGGGVGLATEWIFGEDALSAAAALRGLGTPGWERHLLELSERIASAFAVVHRAGMLHGDVHPRNVLVERSGCVRLIDFGLARDIATVSAQDPRGGVPFYFDPEFAQAQRGRGAVAASCVAEQYSVAALLYQMWTGVHYLDWSLERAELLRQIVEDQPVSFQARRARLWPELEAVLRRALSKRPEDRYADLRVFASALGNLLEAGAAPDRHAGAARSRPPPEQELRDRSLARYALRGEATREGLRQAPRSSVNYGAAGIAYALLRIARRRLDPGLLALADLWSQKALATAAGEQAFYEPGIQIERKTVGERSLFHGYAGLHCVRALVSAAQRDAGTFRVAAEAFVEQTRGSNEGLQSGHILDAVLGKGSLLLGCAELVEAIPALPAFDLLAVRTRGQELADELAGFIASETIQASGRLQSLGIAHGWSGLLFALLRWVRATRGELPPLVRSRIEELVELGEPHGAGLRWPTVAGGSAFMDGWCNGAAGHSMLFALAGEALGNPRFTEVAERAALSAWRSELPLGTLCCGQAGIGYAMLSLHRVTGSPLWLQRAGACAARAAGDRSVHFLRDALYKGAVGAALLTEELETPGSAAMPLFEAVR